MNRLNQSGRDGNKLHWERRLDSTWRGRRREVVMEVSGLRDLEKVKEMTV